ncbi:MAG: FAD-dependent oxidoreductase [Bacilli bacterium]
MKFDAVIVGSGLGGLACGIKLLELGHSVAIIEKHHIPGGYATNFKTVDKNKNVYTFDVSLHGIGMPHKGDLFKDLGIFEDISWIRKEENMTLLTETNEIDVPDTFEDYREQLQADWPLHHDAIAALFQWIWEFNEEMYGVYKGTKTPRKMIQIQNVTLDSWLRQFVDDDAFVERFGYLWLYYGLPPRKLSAFYYLAAWISYHIGGTYYIKGGAGTFSKTLSSRFKQLGGTLILNDCVTTLVNDAKEITSIHTKKGKNLTAKQFILNSAPESILPLLETPTEEMLAFQEKCTHQEKSTSLSQMYIALNTHPKFFGLTKSDYMTMKNTHDENWKMINNGNYEEMDFCVTNYAQLDPETNANGYCLCVVWGDQMKNWPAYNTENYKSMKQTVTDTFLRRLEGQWPGITDCIQLLSLATPHTMQRYTNNPDGAVYGFAQSPSQAGTARTAYQTPLQNLWLAGSWTQPGGGYEGALTSGITCASILHQSQENSKEGESLPDVLTYMHGMCSILHSENARGVDKCYVFNFTDKPPLSLRIKNNQCTLTEEKLPDFDVEITTTWSTWYAIATKKLSGEIAFRSGIVQIKGDFPSFSMLGELFSNEEIKQEERTQVHPMMLPMTLLSPALIAVALSFFSNTGVISSFLILFICLKWLFTHSRNIQCTSFDALLIVWSAFALLTPSYSSPIWLVTFAIASGTLCICRPYTLEYESKHISTTMRNSGLYQKIHLHISGFWSLTYFVIALLLFVLESPFSPVVLTLCGFTAWLSNVYPNWYLNKGNN